MAVALNYIIYETIGYITAKRRARSPTLSFLIIFHNFIFFIIFHKTPENEILFIFNITIKARVCDCQ